MVNPYSLQSIIRTMSSSKKPIVGSTSGGMKKCQGSESRNVIGVSQSNSQTVDEYKVEFFDKAESLGLLDDEMLLVKWFRDGLREDIKVQVRKITVDESMDQILEIAYSVESRLMTTSTIPEVYEDKCMVICEDKDNNDEDPEEDPEEDPAEDPEEDSNNDYMHGDYQDDPRYWVYDDLDQWGFGTPPH